MKATLITLLASTASIALANPHHHRHIARATCNAPTDPSCKELHDACVALPATWLQNPWSNRVCVAAATCYGVGNLLTSGACRQNKAAPNPRTLPSLSDAVYNNFGATSGAITAQNYVDFIYGTLKTNWPSNVSIVKGWWTSIATWAAFPSQNVPRKNFNDWLLYSSAPSTNPPTTTTTKPPSTPTPTPTHLTGIVTACKHDVSVSFDDGPYTANRNVVNQFNNAGAKTNFFVNGNNYACIYDSARVADLRFAYESGHVISSHTWFHTDITTISDAQLGSELDKLETALWKILGVKPAIFRPPYGNYNQRNLNYLNSRGYTVVTWNLDSEDSVGASPDKSMSLIKAGLKAKSMILNHETVESTPKTLLPQEISYIKSKGFKMVTVAQCLDIPPYQKVGSYGTRDSSWKC